MMNGRQSGIDQVQSCKMWTVYDSVEEFIIHRNMKAERSQGIPVATNKAQGRSVGIEID